MQALRSTPPGLYGALGIRTTASPREIEQAFLAWGARFRAGETDLERYRRAECAYHLLSDAQARARHDRQLGLCTHPAWSAAGERAARAGVRRAVRELARGRSERALLLLLRAARVAPGDPAVRSYLALALARAGGELHEAARHARFAVERRPAEPAFLFNLAEVYAAAGLRGRSLGALVRAWRAVLASFLRRRPGCDVAHRAPQGERVPSKPCGGSRRRPGTGGAAQRPARGEGDEQRKWLKG
jgi:tetratricopeptide (TPR) repeat protein